MVRGLKFLSKYGTQIALIWISSREKKGKEKKEVSKSLPRLKKICSIILGWNSFEIYAKLIKCSIDCFRGQMTSNPVLILFNIMFKAKGQNLCKKKARFLYFY